MSLRLVRPPEEGQATRPPNATSPCSPRPADPARCPGEVGSFIAAKNGKQSALVAAPTRYPGRSCAGDLCAPPHSASE
jgi:hypothetical protein